ncbi:MAG: adenylosuccinate lyase [Acidobacteriota bacterium]
MIGRYCRPEMGRIWDLASQYASWLEVELAVAEAMGTLGRIPEDALVALRKAEPPAAEEVAAIEARTGHDLIAFLEAIEEQVGPVARYLHLGLTSSDVLDTSLALRCRRATDLLLAGCDQLIELFARRALQFRDLPMVGRTHGVHAEPITLGLKFLRWHQEFSRGRERLERARQVIAYGQVSGAVGSYGTIDPRLEEIVCRSLGLEVEPVSSQIVPRDRHAEFLGHLAVVAASIDNVATEIRGLQRTEIGELEEPFGRDQKGSSAMPHKRNPVKCENLVGLARLVRAYANAGLENVALWHERDISHSSVERRWSSSQSLRSSVERVAIPDSCILLDFMLHRLYGIVDGLEVHADRMRENLERTNGLIFSSRVLEAMLEAGVARSEAYRLVQRAAMSCWQSGESFRQRLADDAEVREQLGGEQLERAFDLQQALAGVATVFARVLGDRGQRLLPQAEPAVAAEAPQGKEEIS